MKTSVTLEEDVYRQLVNKSIESFGSTKGISALINKCLRMHLNEKKATVKTADSFDEFLKMRITGKQRTNAVQEIDVTL